MDLDTQDWLAAQFAAHGRPDMGNWLKDYRGRAEVWTQVLAEAKRGDVLDAITTAERMLKPKFWHRGEALMAYQSVMSAANDNNTSNTKAA